MNQTRRTYTIRNPQKWLGKTIQSFDLKQQLMWQYDVTVCEWTNKVIPLGEASPYHIFSHEQFERILQHPQHDAAYYYSAHALDYFAQVT